MPFTSSHLLLTKETDYYLQANANKGHQETLAGQTPKAGTRWKGLLFQCSRLIKEMPIKGGLWPGWSSEETLTVSNSSKKDSTGLSRDDQHLLRKLQGWGAARLGEENRLQFQGCLPSEARISRGSHLGAAILEQVHIFIVMRGHFI